MKVIQDQLKESTSAVAVLPMHGLSAKTGQGTEDLLPAAMELYDVWNKRITTSRLNSWREKVSVACLHWCSAAVLPFMSMCASVLLQCLLHEVTLFFVVKLPAVL